MQLCIQLDITEGILDVTSAKDSSMQKMIAGKSTLKKPQHVIIVKEKGILPQTAEKGRNKETLHKLPHLCTAMTMLSNTQGEKKGEARVDIKGEC